MEADYLHEYLVAIGGNLEPRFQFLSDAIELVRRECGDVLNISSIMESEPIGAATEPFLNGAFRLLSEFEPLALLHKLQKIELDLGRTREIRWGNRTIDLDIVQWRYAGSVQSIDDPHLKIPHPSFRDRELACPLFDSEGF